MAVLRFPADEPPQRRGPVAGDPGEERVVENESEIRASLAALGIDYERWDLSRVAADAPAEAVLTAYADEIDAMKRRGGYVTADVIDVNPETPGLDSMLARFDKEHTHSEDEVRFILAGRGIFFLHLGERVVSVEVGHGDMLRVPRGTTHWFTLCEDRRIRAIRWFQDTAGWTPHYTGTGVDRKYQPLCFGPAYLGPRAATTISA
ncbi:MAG TPA: cupin domain-containing protein [Terracidiphilus sp.]|nr:cupin domain-containing protein [Terracidiphilus sp.]